ncbi:hypothetical protein BDN72DRAFT_53387 [Pluteus cervinus]|uniref:Uncharacterized protein n=1 Tax=Pluteus cervinus TaxID=181527 RepID=A0ACD3B9A3_9AGAR|nr:hypothetical protein BDN72DRAFT_53387 [Pluteus cervinus]
MIPLCLFSWFSSSHGPSPPCVSSSMGHRSALLVSIFPDFSLLFFVSQLVSIRHSQPHAQLHHRFFFYKQLRLIHALRPSARQFFVCFWIGSAQYKQDVFFEAFRRHLLLP